jgi:ATPase subunit of ABC transporter with duplicated ATPase domains
VKEIIMLSIQDVSYIHRNGDLLFENLSFSVARHAKVALIGRNGSGKSILIKILAGLLPPSSGVVNLSSPPYYVPQHYGQFDNHTVAEALQIDAKINALHESLRGDVANLSVLDDDWTIEERCMEALAYWDLFDMPLNKEMRSLSGGEKTKVFLAGISIHDRDIILMDEPTNHLDLYSRKLLYDFIQSTSKTFVIVSHDRSLLQVLHSTYELAKDGISAYGGNYDLYLEQKKINETALYEGIRNRERALKQSLIIARETMERKQKMESRGKKNMEKSGIPRIAKKTLKDNAERSSTRLKDAHTEKIGSITEELQQLRNKIPDINKMRMDFQNSGLHSGKVLVAADGINYYHELQPLWDRPLSFQVRSGERINVIGKNGSGKTTLLKLILGSLKPKTGILNHAEINAVYIDQDYSLINNQLTVYEQAQQYNIEALPEHDVKIRLNRFLFNRDTWDKPGGTLSGGEKMRLLLCCLMISNQSPDLFVLDEPTNNLDIENIEILTRAINDYRGTLIVVSHDAHFLKEINVERVIKLD